MGKETVRYPDSLVNRIAELVEASDTFESKSEFHRFASDFLLTLVDPNHDPSVLGHREILQSLEADRGQSLTPNDGRLGDADQSFFNAYVQVRRHLLHGEVEMARTYVTDTFDQADPQALLLDELIGRYQQETAEPSTPGPNTDGRSAGPQQADTHTSDVQPRASADNDDPSGGQSAADQDESPAEEADQESATDPPRSVSPE